MFFLHNKQNYFIHFPHYIVYLLTSINFFLFLISGTEVFTTQIEVRLKQKGQKHKHFLLSI